MLGYDSPEERFYLSSLQLPGIEPLLWGGQFSSEAMRAIVRNSMNSLWLSRRVAGGNEAKPEDLMQQPALRKIQEGWEDGREALWYRGSQIEKKHPAMVLAHQVLPLQLAKETSWKELCIQACLCAELPENMVMPLQRWNSSALASAGVSIDNDRNQAGQEIMIKSRKVSRDPVTDQPTVHIITSVMGPQDHAAQRLAHCLHLHDPGFSHGHMVVAQLGEALKALARRSEPISRQQLRVGRSSPHRRALAMYQGNSMAEKVLPHTLGMAQALNLKALAERWFMALQSASAGESGIWQCSNAGAQISVAWAPWIGPAPWGDMSKDARLAAVGVRVYCESAGHDQMMLDLCHMMPATITGEDAV